MGQTKKMHWDAYMHDLMFGAHDAYYVVTHRTFLLASMYVGHPSMCLPGTSCISIPASWPSLPSPCKIKNNDRTCIDGDLHCRHPLSFI